MLLLKVNPVSKNGNNRDIEIIALRLRPIVFDLKIALFHLNLKKNSSGLMFFVSAQRQESQRIAD